MNYILYLSTLSVFSVFDIALSPFFLIFPTCAGICNQQAGKRMSHSDKVEVMDFLINVLKDHEKSLDTLITRAEDVIEDDQLPRTVTQKPPPLKITLRNWTEFKDRAIEDELACFAMLHTSFVYKAFKATQL